MKKYKIINSYHLKIIALICMIIDHLAATVLTDIDNAIYDGYTMYPLIMIMRIIGRVSFPIYCYLIVQGFIHTRCVWKYALRLFMFAIISEWPFDIAFNKTKFVEFEYNNVFFTLFLGLLFIWALSCFDKLKSKYLEQHKQYFIAFLIHLVYAVLIFILFVINMAICNKFPMDYGMMGILCIIVMYILRQKPVAAYAVGALLISGLSLNYIQLFALIGVIPIAMYNGEKGKGLKWLFYALYPIHLIILVLISMIVGVY
ncbi:MAG: conjugal transfer protein TraX [Lachnospiraceae bacterium]|nr:conjugal transfer protein TraX [Lachnospiraceae bacterium]